MLTLAQQAVKLPIFRMFRFTKFNGAQLFPEKDGRLVVKFYDNSKFVLYPDGTMKTTWFIQYGELFQGLHAYFLAVSEKDAIAQADEYFATKKSYWYICKQKYIETIDMAGCPIPNN